MVRSGVAARENGYALDEAVVRLLHRRSELGYTSRTAEAMRGEPEAVDAETQRQLTQAAERAAVDRRLATWQSCRDRIERELPALAECVPESDLRVLERWLVRVDRGMA